jgi:DNA replication and repair protein RecF
MLQKLTLQNFRNYSKKTFGFSPGTTLIVGPNAVGKTNILEAVYALATGKSFRAETESEVIKTKQEAGVRSQEEVAKIYGTTEELGLEIIWDARNRFSKLYRVNGVGKRQMDFVGNLRCVLFSPQDIEIVADSPSTRRRYLDSVLSLVHKDYRAAARIYEKALRQRNRLLWLMREKRLSESETRLEYWDELLIANGKIIHEYRKKFLEFINELEEDFFPLTTHYDHSIISQIRLEKYAQEELLAATTLIGPHRDDFIIYTNNRIVKSFGSRGEQRMAAFTLKLGELEYVTKIVGERPILLLDDIFSELDHENRHRLLEVIPSQQTIMTTTDLHLVEKTHIKDFGLSFKKYVCNDLFKLI